MGRPKKPTALKILQGNPGQRPLNKNEPKYNISSEVPESPSFLSRYAKKEWKRIAPIVHKNGLLTDADINMLAGYCQAYHRWVECEKHIRAHGYTVVTDKGNIIQRPEVGIANKAMKEMRDFGKEFGLTPSSRANLHIEKQEEQEDPFMTFVRGGKSNG